MTREDKLWSMRMIDLEKVADKLGIKINKKASKAKAIEKILAAENEWEKPYDQKYETEKEKQNKSDIETEKTINKSKDKPKDKPKNKPEKKHENELEDTPPEKKSPGRGALLEFNGKAQNICAWAKELGISANTLYGRIYKMNWSIEKAFNTPAKKK